MNRLKWIDFNLIDTAKQQSFSKFEGGKKEEAPAPHSKGLGLMGSRSFSMEFESWYHQQSAWNSPVVNTVVYLGSVVIYRRFIYGINSNKVDFDLIKNFKKSLYEKLYLEFTVKKRSDLPKFCDFWGDGKGLFRINGNSIDIRLYTSTNVTALVGAYTNINYT